MATKLLVGVALEDRVEQIEVAQEDLINFPEGIVGFEEFRRYALFQMDHGLYLLQTVSDPHVGFVVLDPATIDPCYPSEFPEEELGPLGLGQDERPVLLCVTTLSVDGTPESVNLRAPIAINPAARLGAQVVLQDSMHPTRCRLTQSLDGHVMLDPSNGSRTSPPAEAPVVLAMGVD